MSSLAVHEIKISAEQIAGELDSDFQFVADRLPAEAKQGYSGETFTLASVKGIGILWATYCGQRDSGYEEAICQFVVRIGVLASGSEVRLGYTKEYELSYQTLYDEGPLSDLKPTTTAELASCPAPLSTLAFTVRSLREEFGRLRGENLVHTDEIVQLDVYRQA